MAWRGTLFCRTRKCGHCKKVPKKEILHVLPRVQLLELGCSRLLPPIKMSGCPSLLPLEILSLPTACVTFILLEILHLSISVHNFRLSKQGTLCKSTIYVSDQELKLQQPRRDSHYVDVLLIPRYWGGCEHARRRRSQSRNFGRATKSSRSL